MWSGCGSECVRVMDVSLKGVGVQKSHYIRKLPCENRRFYTHRGKNSR
jgi:hypothetical protein